jgi:hypothetical protein
MWHYNSIGSFTATEGRGIEKPLKGGGAVKVELLQVDKNQKG